MLGSARRSLPSPAIVVAVGALVAALAGTALAGTDAQTAAINKKSVKKIAQKQVTKLAPELSVASAANAEQLGGVAASGYLSSAIVARFKDTSVPAGSGGDADASCAAGEKVISGGVVFPGFASDDVSVVSSRPNAFTQGATFNSWHGSGRNDTGGAKTLRVYAICAQQ